jgi:hypothetical protein
MTTLKVYRQDWLESEAGWGARPDGYSLHADEADRDAFVKEYWDRMPNEVPDEYSRPHGDGYTVEVDEVMYKAVVESRNGIRRYR